MDAFINEFSDENMAELHFTHHQKRRVKNLMRLNVMVQMRGAGEDNNYTSMPSLSKPRENLDLA